MQRESDPLCTSISTLTTTSLTLLSLQTFLSPLFKSRLAKSATTQIKRWLSATTFRFLGGSSLSVQEAKRCTCTLSSLQKTKRANPLLFFLLKQAGTSNSLLTSKSTSIRKVPPWTMGLGLEDNAYMSPQGKERADSQGEFQSLMPSAQPQLSFSSFSLKMTRKKLQNQPKKKSSWGSCYPEQAEAQWRRHETTNKCLSPQSTVRWENACEEERSERR